MLLISEIRPTQYTKYTTLMIPYFHLHFFDTSQYVVFRMCYIATRSKYGIVACHETTMLSFNVNFKSNLNKIVLLINRGQTEQGILVDDKSLDHKTRLYKRN